MPWRGINVTSDNVHLPQDSPIVIKAIDIYIVDTEICRAQVLVIPRHLDTADMRTVASLGDTSEPLVKHFVRDGIHCPRAGIQMEHRDLSIVVTCTEQELVLIVCREITASHTVCGSCIHKLQISVRQDPVAWNPCVRDRVEILPVVRDRDIWGIGDMHGSLLTKTSVLQINIIDLNAMLIAHRIGRYISYTLLFCHSVLLLITHLYKILLTKLYINILSQEMLFVNYFFQIFLQNQVFALW